MTRRCRLLLFAASLCATLLGCAAAASAQDAKLIAAARKEGVVTWVPNPALADRIPATTRAAVDSTNRAIVAGTFVVPGAFGADAKR